MDFSILNSLSDGKKLAHIVKYTKTIF